MLLPLKTILKLLQHAPLIEHRKQSIDMINASFQSLFKKTTFLGKGTVTFFKNKSNCTNQIRKNFFSLSKNNILIPKSSRPITASHDPGVSGVISAKKPRKTSIIPKIFFQRFKFLIFKLLI